MKLVEYANGTFRIAYFCASADVWKRMSYYRQG